MEANKPTYKVLQPLILAATIAVGIMIGYKLNDKPEISLISKHVFPKDSLYHTGRVEELIRFIENKYVDTINNNVLIDAAIQAVLAHLDPHSIYLNPAEAKDQQDQMNGKYYGIGVENYFIDDTVHISHVISGGPAFHGGLKVFDKIIAIDTDTVAGKKLAYEDIRQKLRKAQGHDVQLLIMRDGNMQTYTLQVGEVKVRSVQSGLIPEIETALIRIDKFGTNTYKEFMEEVEKWFGTHKAKHLIIDLRNNPGGYLPEAVNILSQIFKEKDKMLLYTEGRSGKRNEYKTTGKYFFNIEQIVVLIDENSASASEIIAGAIQDLDRGIIIGRRSFGKGLVQEQFPLSNGGAIRMTVSRYYTPSGRSIQKDYTDINKYNDDIRERYEHGDLFYKDSTTTKQSEKYYTKLYKREVPGSGGITPDIFIGLNETVKDSQSFEVYQLIPEFAFKYLSRHPQMLSKGITGLEADENYIEAFDIFMASHQVTSYSRKTGTQALKYFDTFKSQVEQITAKNNQDDQRIPYEDIYIKTAISTIKEGTSPKDFK